MTFSSPIFWGALGNTILLGVAFLGITIPLATILASMLNRLRRGSTPLKVIYFLPQLTSSVAVAIMFNYVFQPDWGLLNGIQIWWTITLPSLRPTFIFLIMTGTIDALARFGDLWTLGGPGGAPARSLQSIVMFMFQTGFESNDVYLAAATAVVFFFIVLAVSIIAFRGLLAREFAAQR